jgi:hypothetical protein
LVSERLLRRIRTDFPEPASAEKIARRLAELAVLDTPHQAWATSETRERIQAAIIVKAHGDTTEFEAAYRLATIDFRDLLMGSGLEHEDWPQRLLDELGPHA